MRLAVLALLLPAVAQAADRRHDEERGKLLYERHCTACHGERAGGDGPATTALVVTVPDLQGKVKPDQATVDVVLMGRGPMPAFETSFEAIDARRVLAYMEKLNTPAPEPGAAPEPDEEEAEDEAGGDAQTPE